MIHFLSDYKGVHNSRWSPFSLEGMILVSRPRLVMHHRSGTCSKWPLTDRATCGLTEWTHCSVLVEASSLAGHWRCASVKHGWQQLPVCGQRVTLGDVLFWGTLCLCLRRRLEGWADLVLRGADVFWVNTRCKTKTRAANTGQPSGGDPIVSPLPLSRHERGEPSLCVPELQGVLVLVPECTAIGQVNRVSPFTWHLTCPYRQIINILRCWTAVPLQRKSRL